MADLDLCCLRSSDSEAVEVHEGTAPRVFLLEFISSDNCDLDIGMRNGLVLPAKRIDSVFDFRSDKRPGFLVLPTRDGLRWKYSVYAPFPYEFHWNILCGDARTGIEEQCKCNQNSGHWSDYPSSLWVAPVSPRTRLQPRPSCRSGAKRRHIDEWATIGS